MKMLFATDLHGNPGAYERFLRLAGRKNIDAAVIGGDITPVGFLGFFVQVQRDFLENYLLPRLEKFRGETGKAPFIMMGNDDFRLNMDVLESGERLGLLRLMSQRVHRIGSRYIAGYSYINESPFLLKDWEKGDGEIRKDLEALAGKADPKKSVFVFHAPPFNTKLDMVYDGTHVGSRAIREFIEKFQPLLTLHGHIHESPRVSGSFEERIGKTLCINPGNANMVLADLETGKSRVLKF